jgi:hypothetical protein
MIAGVAADRADTLLALAATLEERDEALATDIALVTHLADRVAGLRRRAEEIRTRLAEIPGELEVLEDAARQARAAADRAREELVEAEKKLAQVAGSRRSDERDLARAQRTAQDAREALADADRRILRVDAQRQELRDVERALAAEADGLAVDARDVAAAVDGAPRVPDAAKTRPGASLEELDDWGGRARAALFVARGTLESERERIVVEANALAASVLGEEVAGTSVALARRRIEDALG